MRGHLKLIVLKFLAKNPLSGYDLMKGIGQETGWKPSTGSMYPLLESLISEKLASSRRDGRRTLYQITESGRNFLEEGLKRKNEMLERHIEDLKVFESFTGKGECSIAIEMMSKLKAGKMPFRELNPELINFNENLFRIYKSENLERWKRDVRKILGEANRKLERLK